MKVNFLKQSVSQYLPRMLKVVPSKGLETLKAVWIEARDNMISLGVNSRDVAYVVRGAAKSPEPGLVGVADASRLIQFLRKLPDGDISIEEKDKGKILVRQERRRGMFPLLDKSWFPGFPETSEADAHIDGPSLNECLKFARQSVSPSTDLDGVLACVYAHPREEGINVVGCNGVQLSMVYKTGTGLESAGPGLLIPGQYIGFLSGILEDGVSRISVRDGGLTAVTADLTQVVRVSLMMEEYLDYDGMVGDMEGAAVRIGFDEIMPALERLAIVSDLESHAFLMTGDSKEQQAVLSVQSSQGSGSEVLTAEIKQGFDPVWFNLESMIGLLRAMPGTGHAVFLVKGPDKPVIVYPEDAGTNLLSVIMPVYTQEADYVEG